MIQDADGEPWANAIALVATLRRQVYRARSERRGRYPIDGVPPGR